MNLKGEGFTAAWMLPAAGKFLQEVEGNLSRAFV